MDKRAIAVTFLAAMTLIGCMKPAENRQSAGREFEVERLFSFEGCTAYRFYDGRYIHYVRCGDHVSTHWTVSSGKSSRQERVETN